MTKLKDLYRNKILYVNLPSEGNSEYYPSGITLAADNTIGIKPMNIQDEIKLKSPDYLFTGEGLLDMFKSCVEGIENPKEIPIADADLLLFGVKLVTDGKEINIESTCTHCEKVNSNYLDLSFLLNDIKYMDKDNKLIIKEDDINLEIYLRPTSIENRIKQRIKSLHDSKSMEFLSKEINDENRKDNIESYNKIILNLSNLLIDITTDSILYINIIENNSTTKIDDKDEIREWLSTINSGIYKQIKNKIDEMDNCGINKETVIKCNECEKDYNTILDFDYMNFFLIN